MINRRHRILPAQHFLRCIRADVTGARAHIAVGQLEPGAGKRIFERLGVLQPVLRDLLVGRIGAQRQVRREHDRRVIHALAVGIGHELLVLGVLGLPLDGAGRALRLHPFKTVQIFQILHRPLGWGRRPRAFQARGDGIGTLAAAHLVFPTKALLFKGFSGRFLAHVGGAAGTVRLAERVATGDQRGGFLVVHRHAAEGFADIIGGQLRIRHAIRAFRVHIDQAHLHGAQGPAQLAAGAIALVVQHLVFRAPIDLVGFPIIGAATGKTERLEAHGFKAHVAGQHHQIGPAQRAAIFGLHRPQQAAGLVEVAVVRPRVQRFKALLATTGAAAAIGDAIGAGAVPGHADEERAVIAIVSRPPGLGGGQHLGDIGLHRLQIELGKLGRIIEIRAVGIGLRRLPTQRGEIDEFRPPELRRGVAAHAGFHGSGAAGAQAGNGQCDDRCE